MRHFQVLLVDDEGPLLDELYERLIWSDIGVTLASNGLDALAILEARPDITVVLSDVRMPFMDGTMLAQRVLSSRSDAVAVEVTLMTGHGWRDIIPGSARIDIFDVLHKPMELDNVLDVVQRSHAKALARRAAHLDRLDVHGLAPAGDEADRGTESVHPSAAARRVSDALRCSLVPMLSLPFMLDLRGDIAASLPGGALESLRQGGRRLSEMADDLRAWLDPSGEPPHPCQPVAPNRIIEQLYERHRETARQAGCLLRPLVHSEGHIMTNADALICCLGRLVGNAIRAAPQDGLISLSATDRGPDHVQFRVRDSGGGMTEDELGAAWQPFQSLNRPGQRDIRLGLGIPLAARTAQSLGGRLAIESAPGVGTGAVVDVRRAPVLGREA